MRRRRDGTMHRRRDARVCKDLEHHPGFWKTHGRTRGSMRCNNLYYCGKHGRGVCNECEHIEVGFAFLDKVKDAFKIPKNGQPEYPVSVESTLVAKRWLDV